MIKKLNDINKNPKFFALIYGQSGIGKTYLAHGLDSPLILDCESGLLTLTNIKDSNFNPDIISIKTRKDLSEAFIYIKNNKDKYNYIFIDSLTEISDILLKDATERKSHGLQVYAELKTELTKLIKFFRNLSTTVIFTALETEDKDGDLIKIKPSVSGSMKSLLPQFFDFVFHMKFQENSEGKHVRVFDTEGSNQVVAKSRSNKLNSIEEADLKKIIDKLTTTKEETASE